MASELAPHDPAPIPITIQVRRTSDVRRTLCRPYPNGVSRPELLQDNIDRRPADREPTVDRRHRVAKLVERPNKARRHDDDLISAIR